MEQIRQRHQFVVVGYVIMPQHVHLLFTEPERGNPSLVLAALKQTFGRVAQAFDLAGICQHSGCPVPSRFFCEEPALSLSRGWAAMLRAPFDLLWLV
jgi:REP element-mobilizing transposase RayT